ncbi:toll/interleukin-1 receptor domain-containing protein [Dactylosporangium sp. NPDC005572]|uniref:toll/interleukin-1 receptor domain-containing protein n=1 Tax=Dactylosporangium sp. NPDC005572 TaxID=3156889 RepID=UPI0033B58DBB
MPQIFISYRSGDESFAAVTLDHLLCERFGPDAVFRDARSIPPATDYTEVLQDRLDRSDLMIVVIGPRWHLDAQGGKRLHDPSDPVRQEVSFALRKGVPVLPVLVGDAVLPASADLPEDIRTLPVQQYRRMRAATADADAQRVASDVTARLEFREAGTVAVMRAPASLAPVVRRAAAGCGLPGVVLSHEAGVLRLTQPGAAHARAVAVGLTGALDAVLRDVPDAVPLRIAMDHGTSAGGALRLLDDPAFDLVLRRVSARLVLVLSDALHSLAVRPGGGIDKAAYTRFATAAGPAAWAHVPGRPGLPGLPADATRAGHRPGHDPGGPEDDGGGGHHNVVEVNHGRAVLARDIYGDVVLGDRIDGGQR